MAKVSAEFPANFHWLICLCNSNYSGRLLIFFWNRHQLGDVYQYVTANTTRGEVFMFHKQTAPETKAAILSKLSNSLAAGLQVVLCTSSFSLGLDLKSIEFVIHYGPSQTAEDYLQETGRAAREPAKQGHAILIDFPSSQAGKRLDDTMKRYLKQADCKRTTLNAKFHFSETNKPANCCDFCQWDIDVPGNVLNLILSSADTLASPDISSCSSSAAGSIQSLGLGEESP